MLFNGKCRRRFEKAKCFCHQLLIYILIYILLVETCAQWLLKANILVFGSKWKLWKIIICIRKNVPYVHSKIIMFLIEAHFRPSSNAIKIVVNCLLLTWLITKNMVHLGAILRFKFKQNYILVFTGTVM